MVGNNPNPLAQMGRADIGSSQHSPSRIKPQRGQVSEDGAKSANNEHWRVFHEDESGSYFADDSRHFHPESAAFSSDAGPFAGCGYVLARKPARYHVNNASPRSSVKGANFIPNRERREQSVILSGEQYAGGIGVVFNGADGSPAEDGAAKDAAPRSSKEREFA